MCLLALPLWYAFIQPGAHIQALRTVSSDDSVAYQAYDNLSRLPVEIYTPERKAEFILSSDIDHEDYQAARETVRQMGLDPDRIDHGHNPAPAKTAIESAASEPAIATRHSPLN